VLLLGFDIGGGVDPGTVPVLRYACPALPPQRSTAGTAPARTLAVVVADLAAVSTTVAAVVLVDGAGASLRGSTGRSVGAMA
jgi:hypothetical protein